MFTSSWPNERLDGRKRNSWGHTIPVKLTLCGAADCVVGDVSEAVRSRRGWCEGHSNCATATPPHTAATIVRLGEVSGIRAVNGDVRNIQRGFLYL